MAINGSLSTMNVSDLLQFLAAGKKTGLLKFSHAKVVKGIYFENGIIVGSSTNDPGEYLGQVLIHYGKINESQLQAAMEIQRGEAQSATSRVQRNAGEVRPVPRRLGQILVAQGLLTEEEVLEVLKIRTLDIIYNLFVWNEAHFEFSIEGPLPADFTRVNLEANTVILDGVYRADELARYRTLIPSDRTVMELGIGWTSSLDLGKGTRELFYLLEKRMSVAEICAITLPSLYSTIACTEDCGCTTTSTSEGFRSKSQQASITSKPLFMSVAESMVMRFPIFQVG